MSKKNILIVDDDKTFVDVVSQILVENDFDVIQTYSGFDAFKALEKKEVDLILLDIVMPDFDGLEFCRVAKKMKPNIPVIIVTGQESQVVQSSRKFGADEIIYKPFKMSVLLDNIKNFIK